MFPIEGTMLKGLFKVDATANGVYDDAAGKKLNDTPEQITVLETFGTAPIIGTGYTMTAEEQLAELSQNAAKAVERYLVRQQEAEGWFVPEIEAEPNAIAIPEAG